MKQLAYSISDFKALTGIKSRASVYAEINAGRLKTIKYGRRRLIPATEAEAWFKRLVESQENEE